MKTTILPVRIVADLLTPEGERFDALLPMTITVEEGMITVGTFNGPDMWRAKLEDLT